MKEIFKNKSLENIKIAELAYANDCFNASANRAYYAAFHAAIYAIYSIGIEPRMDHKPVHTIFIENYFNRRKVLPSKYKSYLSDLIKVRIIADYGNAVSKKIAKQQLQLSKEFVHIVLEGMK